MPASKLRNYLLDRRHPIGAPKARLFAALGYRRRNWRELRRALKAMAATRDAKRVIQSPYGQKYEVRGILHGVAGQSLPLVSIWIVPAGESIPRFVTAYPEE